MKVIREHPFGKIQGIVLEEGECLRVTNWSATPMKVSGSNGIRGESMVVWIDSA